MSVVIPQWDQDGTLVKVTIELNLQEKQELQQIFGGYGQKGELTPACQELWNEFLRILDWKMV